MLYIYICADVQSDMIHRSRLERLYMFNTLCIDPSWHISLHRTDCCEKYGECAQAINNHCVWADLYIVRPARMIDGF